MKIKTRNKNKICDSTLI